MKSYTAVFALSLIAVSAPISSNDSVYTCATEQEIGFTSHGSKGWVGGELPIRDGNYLVKPLKDELKSDFKAFIAPSTTFYVTDLGSDLPDYFCETRAAAVQCSGLLAGEFNLNLLSGRFLKTNTLGYWTTDPWEKASIEIGTCTKIPRGE